MDMAKKASRLVFEPPHELKLEIDALLLSVDHPFAHSSLRKILAVQQLRVGHKPAGVTWLGPTKASIQGSDLSMAPQFREKN
jgi:hypothetical protein